MVSAFQKCVVLWSVFCMPAIFFAGPAAADHATSHSSPPNDIAGHILHGIGASTQSPTVTISVPQADVIWHNHDFPHASISHAKSCWSAYTNWWASYPGYYASASPSLPSTISTVPSTYVYPTSSTIWPTGNVSTYKLCDGSPRVSSCPTTTYFNNSIPTQAYLYSTVYPTPIPEQACTLSQADCAVMYFGTNINKLNSSNFDNEWASVRLLAACGYPLDLEVPCLVQGGPVEVLYFPVSTTGGDLGGCAEGTTVTSVENPSPVTTLGTTFYPDKVYVSFETLYAAYRSLAGPGGAAVQIGNGYSNKIFEFRSDEISTNCYASRFSSDGGLNPGYGLGTQLNFADLNYPPPATAYECQDQCQSLSYEVGPGGIDVTTHTILPNPCKTIWDDFNPFIAVPTALRSMHPEWASCRFWDHRQANVVFDPPIALKRATAAAKPTLPGYYSMTSGAAMPASTGERPASRTAPALADDIPSATATYADGGENGGSAQISSAQSSIIAASTMSGAPGNDPGDSQSGQSKVFENSANVPDVKATGSSNVHISVIAFTPVASQDEANANTASTPAQQVFAAGDVTITAMPVSGSTEVVEIHGSTVSANGPAVTVDGGVVSMGSNGLVAIHTATASRSQSASSGGSEQTASSSQESASTADGSGVSLSGTSFLVGSLERTALAAAAILLLLFA